MDFIEDYHSHILFIPGIFIEDCPDGDIDLNVFNNKIDLSTIKSENIDLIKDDENDLNLEELKSDSDDDIFSKNTAESDNSKKKRLNLNELLENENPILKNNYSNNVPYEIVPKHFINAKLWIKSTNLMCCYCHDIIRGIPYPIVLGQNKILIPENEEINETFISLLTPVFVEKNVFKSTINETIEYIDKSSDDHLLFSNQTLKEVKAYKIHNILCCDIVCVGNYIRKINDTKINNRRESIQMSISVYKEITGNTIEDIPEKDLWIVMEQYCGLTGQKRNEYREKNLNKEIKLKQAMKINY